MNDKVYEYDKQKYRVRAEKLNGGDIIFSIGTYPTRFTLYLTSQQALEIAEQLVKSTQEKL
jgi:hypothetical protein